MNKYSVCILDGTNLFIRYFSADTKTLDQFGAPCGGTAGVLKGIRHILKELNPHELLIVFDGKNNSKRKQKIDEQYKQGKKYSFIELLPQENKTLFNKQMAKLLLLLKYVPVKVFAVNDVEADDVMGYIKYIYDKFPNEINKYIVSSDADFQQLLDENTFIYNTKKRETFSSDDFYNSNKFNSKNFHIYKTLAGEGRGRDNIPRVLTKRKIMGYFGEFLNEDYSHTLQELEDFINREQIPFDDDEIDRIRKNYDLVNLHTPNISTDSKLAISEEVKKYNSKVYGISNLLVQLKVFGLEKVVYADFITYINRYNMRNNAFSKYMLENS